MKLPVGLKQLYEIQQLIYQRIMMDGCDNDDLKALTDSWERLEERKRILRGKPLPGALRPTATKPKRTSHSKLLIDSVDQS